MVSSEGLFLDTIIYLMHMLFSGVSMHYNKSVYLSDLSYNEREIDLSPNVETILDDYGIISKINSDSSGFDYIPTYAGLEKYPAICVFCKFTLHICI